jgi:hypothetical protein
MRRSKKRQAEAERELHDKIDGYQMVASYDEEPYPKPATSNIISIIKPGGIRDRAMRALAKRRPMAEAA